ncbi:uncharacterized protein LOC143430852 [Xylocopa sonorina]|uniref:uncharacterized protein LOC143430852 n=1 Tax=Xylocopa sonorina TaxID=1818115 RepID=UPI00403AF6B5
MTTRIISLLVVCAVFCEICVAKPTEVLQSPRSLSPAQQTEVASTVDENKREQRSPQFGFLDEDYSDSGSDFVVERSFKHHRKHHHKPGGCGDCSYGQYPSYPPPAIYPVPSYPQQGGGSFATASAGSIDSHGRPEGQSHANAQSASFNIGPYSASFSIAEASSGQRF